MSITGRSPAIIWTCYGITLNDVKIDIHHTYHHDRHMFVTICQIHLLTSSSLLARKYITCGIIVYRYDGQVLSISNFCMVNICASINDALIPGTQWITNVYFDDFWNCGSFSTWLYSAYVRRESVLHKTMIKFTVSACYFVVDHMKKYYIWSIVPRYRSRVDHSMGRDGSC